MIRSAMVAIILVAGCSSNGPETSTDVVTRVIDGDTIELATGDTVRLIGIDTPEEGECGYAEAAEQLTQLVDGQTVTLVPGARDDQDRYGRLLRYVEIDDRDAGLVLIWFGLARTRYDSRDGYGSHPKEAQYIEAEAATGLPVCVPGIPTSDTPGVISGGYPFCEAARADGAAPLREGDPGWNPELDQDDDGEACE